MQLQVAVLLIILGITSSSGVADTDGDTNINKINDVDISSRIFGGTTAARDQYSFVARLVIQYSTGSRTVCSGVVLTTKIILTVAHCVVRPGGERATSVSATLPRGGRYSFRREEIFINPFFNGVYGADIAVLKKDTTLTTFMRNYGTVPSIPVQPVSPTVVPFTPAITAGWGRTSGSRIYSPRLQFANVALMNSADCNNEYADIASTMFPDELICTTTNIAGICAGDWGGPLLTQVNGRQILQGLNMFRRGNDCTNSNPSSAYYNVELAGNWLRATFPEIASLP